MRLTIVDSDEQLTNEDASLLQPKSEVARLVLQAKPAVRLRKLATVSIRQR